MTIKYVYYLINKNELLTISTGTVLRELKKYANRKIYDSSNSKYVTIRNIRDMIRDNETVKVIDDKTGKDITRSVLLQIINDLESSEDNTVLTDYVLQYMIRMYGDPMGSTFAMYLDYSLKNFLNRKSQLQDFMQNSQLKDMQDFTKQMIETWSELAGFKRK